MRRTLDNIESLLASGGAVFDDICQASAFVKRVTAMMFAGKGDLLPVSAFPVDGTWLV